MTVRPLFQIARFFEAVPWWLPSVVIGAGVLLYITPYVEAFVGHRLPEWRRLPMVSRLTISGLFVAGAAMVVWTHLGQFDWMYVLFLLGYARAVEGTTILYLFGRLEALMSAVFRDHGDGRVRSTARVLARWFVRRLRRRAPLIIVTTVLTGISLGLYGSVLVGFPNTPVTVKLAFLLTVSTFYLSTVNTAWVLSRVSDDIGPTVFVGLIGCVVGGELYNVPSALRVFTDVPAVGGPLGSVTTLLVGTIGWFVGLALAVAFFLYRIRNTPS